MMTKYAYYEFEYGTLCIGYNEKAVVEIYRVGENVSVFENENIRSELSDRANSQIRAYLDGKLREFDFPVETHGTDFRQKVWNALLAIPYGETRSYKYIAASIGNPKANRAVGMAAHCNPLGIVIPCHRVIGSDGSLTGYAGGLDFKAALLKIEFDNASIER